MEGGSRLFVRSINVSQGEQLWPLFCCDGVGGGSALGRAVIKYLHAPPYLSFTCTALRLRSCSHLDFVRFSTMYLLHTTSHTLLAGYNSFRRNARKTEPPLPLSPPSPPIPLPPSPRHTHTSRNYGGIACWAERGRARLTEARSVVQPPAEISVVFWPERRGTLSRAGGAPQPCVGEFRRSRCSFW